MKYIVISMLFVNAFCYAQESFIVPAKAPSKQPTSAMSVKEDFVYSAGDLLKQIAELQEQLGRLQKKLLENVMDLVEGKSNGAFAKEKKLSSKQKMVEAVRTIEQRIEELNKVLTQSYMLL